MHEVIFDDLAIEFLEKLPKDIRKRIYNKITKTEENPHRYFEKLVKRNDYKLRIGSYRVIADIDAEKIKVTLIGHRKNIYKK